MLEIGYHIESEAVVLLIMFLGEIQMLAQSIGGAVM